MWRIKEGMEQCVLERLEMMKDFLSEKANYIKQERINEIRKQFLSDAGNISSNLKDTLKRLVLEEETCVIVISYLQSSYITGNHEFYIASYIGEQFVVEELDYTYFSMSSLLKKIEEDVEQMDKELKKEFFRPITAEKEEIHRWYMAQLYKGFDNVFKLGIENIEEQQGNDVYFGGFMDELKLIGRVQVENLVNIL